MTPDELKRRIPLVVTVHSHDPITMVECPCCTAKQQRASDMAALAVLVREALGPEEPLMADLVAVYERGTALADALEAAAQGVTP